MWGELWVPFFLCLREPKPQNTQTTIPRLRLLDTNRPPVPPLERRTEVPPWTGLTVLVQDSRGTIVLNCSVLPSTSDTKKEEEKSLRFLSSTRNLLSSVGWNILKR